VYHTWFKASATKQLRTAPFWVITQPVVVVSYRRLTTRCLRTQKSAIWVRDSVLRPQTMGACMGGQVEETNHCCQNSGRVVIRRYIKKNVRRNEHTNPNESTTLSMHWRGWQTAPLCDSSTCLFNCMPEFGEPKTVYGAGIYNVRRSRCVWNLIMRRFWCTSMPTTCSCHGLYLNRRPL